MFIDQKINIPDIFSEYFNDPIIKKVAYQVAKNLQEGNICLDLETYQQLEDMDIDINNLITSPFVTNEPFTNVQPFVFWDNKLYLHRYFSYETIIIEKIKELINEGKENKEYLMQLLLDNKSNIEDHLVFGPAQVDQPAYFIPWQKIAALSAFTSNFQIITGGPGTGKTSAVAGFLFLYLSFFPENSVALAAPTGKAAARMNESINLAAETNRSLTKEIRNKIRNIEATTIHRLLGTRRESVNFIFNKDNCLRYDLIIIDESSMIDVALMAKLLDAIERKTKLILLGDRNQLTSIGAGSIFGDLCKIDDHSNKFEEKYIDFFNEFISEDENKIPKDILTKTTDYGFVIELKQVFRFKPDNGISIFSTRLLADEAFDQAFIEIFKGTAEREIRITQSPDDTLFLEMLKFYEDYASENDIKKAIEKLARIRILCAVREGDHGIYYFNDFIEKYLKNKRLLNPAYGFYDRQSVMITSNDYNLELFNGDIGIIRKDEEKSRYIAYFPGKDNNIREFSALNLPSYETAFAMTIHKSQGSEFENVIIVLPDDEDLTLLTRELIYTGVTRAKQKVLLIGKDNIIIDAGNRQVERISGIMERFINQ